MKVKDYILRNLDYIGKKPIVFNNTLYLTKEKLLDELYCNRELNYEVFGAGLAYDYSKKPFIVIVSKLLK